MSSYLCLYDGDPVFHQHHSSHQIVQLRLYLGLQTLNVGVQGLTPWGLQGLLNGPHTGVKLLHLACQHLQYLHHENTPMQAIFTL